MTDQPVVTMLRLDSATLQARALVVKKPTGEKYQSRWRLVGMRGGDVRLFVIGRVFFRAATFPDADHLLRTMFAPTPGLMPVGTPALLVMLLLAGTIAHLAPNAFELNHQWQPIAVAGLATLPLLCFVRIYGAVNSPFLYFPF